MEPKVSFHAKDIIQKYANNLFQNATLEFYGIKSAPIKELISIDLPVVEVAQSSGDIAFLLTDNSYLRFEFASSYNKDDLIRFAGYDLRLFKRDGRAVTTVIIFSPNVKSADVSLNIGSLSYNPAKIMMADYNGDAIYAELYEKIESGKELTDADMLKLIFLPLMSCAVQVGELAVNSVKLALRISDKTKRDACIASAVALPFKHLNLKDIEAIKEVLKMNPSEFGKWLYAEELADYAVETAKKALNEGATIDFVKKIFGLSDDKIHQLQEELNYGKVTA